MLYRYRIARVRSESAFQALLEQDRKLLAEFGLQLVSVDVGVNVVKAENVKKGKVNSWDLMSFDERTWGIMLPLLEELRMRAVQGAAGRV